MTTVYDDFYRVRIRNRADNADLLVLTSVPSGTNPYIKEPPRGDGASFNPATNDQMAGSYTILVVDAITSGTDRVITAKLEDINGQLQLGYLKTYVEVSRDGSSWASRSVGYLVLIRLVDAATAELTVQDALRALDGVQLFNPSSTSSIADFLAAWPNRGCLYGGPVLGKFLTTADQGGWQMRVRDGRPSPSDHKRYWLDPMVIYGPGDWSPHPEIAGIAPSINDAVSKLQRGVPNLQAIPFATVVDALSQSQTWPGLVVLIDRGSGLEPFRAIPPGFANVRSNDGSTVDGSTIVAATKAQSGVYVYLDGQTELTLGSVVKVRALTILPSEVSPIYIDRHPIDLLSDLCALAGIGFNDALGVKALFGNGLRISLRITSPQTMGTLLKAAVFDLGIAVRQDSTGRVVPFATRRLSNVLPTKTITDSLIVGGAASVAFEQDVSFGGLQQVIFAHKVQSTLSGAPDGVLERDQEFVELNGDASPLLSGSIEIRLPGMLRSDPLNTAPISQDWVVGEARLFFERFGRAAQAAEFDLIRGDGTTDADTANYGDEVLIDVPQVPNHNKRLGDDGSVAARAMQIVRLAEAASNRPARFVDSGPNVQPLATKPTHTIAASSDLPRTTAEVTITNAATLNGLGYTVRIQIAVVAHGASAPSTNAYTDVASYQLAAIPTGAIRLPAVVAGSDVYVRARSELLGHRPSDWQTGVHVSLSLVDDPTSVAAAAVSGDGSLEDLSWVIGTNASADLTDIWIRPSAAAFSAAVRIATLLAGSTQFRLQGLTPATTYKASVQHRDPVTGDVSDPVDVSFTSDAGVTVLTPPTGPVGFSESSTAAAAFTGVYGLAVVATEFPSVVEFSESVETAVGAGTYGAFAIVGTLPSVSGDFTVFSRTAPNDGLRRRLRARHLRDGTTASGYTVPVTVTPWTYDPLTVEEAAESLSDFKWTDSSDGLTRTFSMVAGSRIHRVAVFLETLAVPPLTDPWPDATSTPVAILTPDPVTGIVTYAVAKPTIQNQAFLQFEPRLDDWSSGPVVRAVVDPSESAMFGSIAFITSGDTSDLTLAITAGVAEFPVQVDVYEDDPSIAPFVTASIAASGSFTKLSAGFAGLGAVSTPMNETHRFWVKLTNVAGQVEWGSPVTVDRKASATAQGTVSIDTNGAPSWSVQGPLTMFDGIYLESTSAFPSDAAVRAGGTVITGRAISRTGGSALTFGQTLYVKVIPRDIAGNELPSISLRGSYQNTTAVKYDTLPGSAIVPDRGTTDFTVPTGSDGAILGVAPSTFKIVGRVPLRVSSGLTIDSLEAYVLFNGTAQGAFPDPNFAMVLSIVRVTRSSGSAHVIQGISTTSGSGAVQFLQATGIGEVVDTQTYAYFAYLTQGNDDPAGVTQLNNFTIGYTQNTISQGL